MIRIHNFEFTGPLKETHNTKAQQLTLGNQKTVKDADSIAAIENFTKKPSGVH